MSDTDLLGPISDAEGQLLIERAGADLLPSEAWPAMLQTIVELFALRLQRRGRTEEQSFEDARELAIDFANYAGGRQIYLPVGERLKLALRDNQIWNEHRGNNIDQLARKYKLTPRQIYAIVAQQTALFRARNQGQLPLEGGSDTMVR